MSRRQEVSYSGLRVEKYLDFQGPQNSDPKSGYGVAVGGSSDLLPDPTQSPRLSGPVG